MAKVNVCLKRSYICVTSLIAIASALMLALTLFTHGHFHRDEEIENMLVNLHIMYSFSIITLVLAIVGVYGACKKKKWALIVFVVGTSVGSLLLIACEIQGLALRTEVVEEMRMHYLNMMPLNNASESFIDDLKTVQMELHCCGLDQGYLDWGNDIPESCLCTEEPTIPCVAAPRDSSLFEHTVDDQPIMIYKESCLPYLSAYQMMFLSILLAVLLGITLFWVSTVAMGIAILCQLSKKEDTPVVVYSSEAKAGNYAVLEDAAELT